MHKQDKKIERELIRELTQVCERGKVRYSGFVWLTHDVDYTNFPQSLKVTLVFNESISDDVMRAEFCDLVGEVQFALEPVINSVLPASKIEACREYTLQ